MRLKNKPSLVDGTGLPTVSKGRQNSNKLQGLKSFLTKSKYRHFVFIGVFATAGLVGLVITNAYSIRTQSVGNKLSGCSASVRCSDGAVFVDGAISFKGSPATQHENHTNIPVVNPTGAILAPNTLEFNRWPNINARADVARPVATIGTNITSGGSPNSPNNEGQFRFFCKYSHFNYDDAIVYPGQSGKAHLHMYWGNTRANAHTTDNTLVSSGGGTCNGNELNRTAYWMPALMDGRGNAIIPKTIIVYYKTRGNTQATSAMPQGLKMIEGNAQGNAANSYGQARLGWHCYNGATSWANGGYTIPRSCPAGHNLEAVVYFPECWNKSKGLGRDSVFWATGSECPSGSVKMPQTSYHVTFWAESDMSQWYLSSDRMTGMAAKPNGSTLHADWYGGWDNSIMNEWINGCIKPKQNCSNGVMGSGRTLTGFWDNAAGSDYLGGKAKMYIPIPK